MKRKRDTKEMAAATAATKTRAKQSKTATAAKSNSLTSEATKAAPLDRPAKKTKSAADHASSSSLKGSSSSATSAVGPSSAARSSAASPSSGLVLGNAPTTIQIVAGSYDGALHGVSATVLKPSEKQADSNVSRPVKFVDTFLFDAHASAIRCLALSPPSAPIPGQGQKIMLATGSTDERINVYNLSAHPPSAASAAASAASSEEQALMAAVNHPAAAVTENAKDRELGTLVYHNSHVTRLIFPTRSKLLSSSKDSTIGVSRTRDWTLLSTIKAPIPKAGSNGVGPRPTGDTEPVGGAPSGINDFAVHPSMKVMISVSRGERCMRLWNLVTGKKAGVLNFDKEMLREIGESKHSTGEGRQVVWGRTFGGDSVDDADDEFAVGFDRNVVAFGMDSRPRCKALAESRAKTHDFHYVDVVDTVDKEHKPFSLLAVATEDGRVVFVSTQEDELVKPKPEEDSLNGKRKSAPAVEPLPSARFIGQVGGAAVGVTGRIKAFKVLPVVETVPATTTPTASKGKLPTRQQQVYYVVAASSTGAVRVWRVTAEDLRDAKKKANSGEKGATAAARQIGQLSGTYQIQDRITCVEAFVMIPRPDDLEDSDEGEEESSGDDDDEEDDE